MVGMPVFLGGEINEPLIIAPIGSRKQPPKLSIPDSFMSDRANLTRLAWAWSGQRIGEVPEAVIVAYNEFLMLWDGVGLRDANQAARPDIDASLKLYDSLADPFARRRRNNQALRLEIKEWRQKRGWSAARAAEELGIPLRTIQNIEQERGFIYSKMLRLAMQALA